jgi:hypothetical protein
MHMLPNEDLCYLGMNVANAAKGGHTNVLKWPHENGCPWDREAFDFAVERGHYQY